MVYYLMVDSWQKFCYFFHTFMILITNNLPKKKENSQTTIQGCVFIGQSISKRLVDST